jgi:hypothetical protein
MFLGAFKGCFRRVHVGFQMAILKTAAWPEERPEIQRSRAATLAMGFARKARNFVRSRARGIKSGS